MVFRPRPASLTLAALTAALAMGWVQPTLADEGHGGHGGDHAGVGLPGVGGGSTPGGVIGGGLAGGVGGPGGLGGGPRIGGGGGGGGSMSPLSPAAATGDFERGGFGGGGREIHGPNLSPLGPTGDLGRAGRDAEELSGGEHGRGLDLSKGDDDLKRDAKELKDAAQDKARETSERGDEATAVLTRARQRQADALMRANPTVIEPDDHGRPIVRGEILALAPSPAVLARAEKLGFRVRSSDALPELGVQATVLQGPRGISAVEALRRLRALDPQGQYDFNHLYQESGAVGGMAAAPTQMTSGDAVRGVRVGLVDGSVAAGHPALSGARLVQRAFAPGGARSSAHATAVASLIAGRSGAFRGAAPGATLFVADVYGPSPIGGSAEIIARALGWLAQAGAPVINISLVGPPNLLLEAAVKALQDRGHIVVAAVGNDGPAAPPLYPASYPGVVAVTGVDARRRVLPEAGRGSHVDFAAPGAEMAAAGLDGGFVAVRGTSFAAPLAAGLLARKLPAADRAGAARAIASLDRQALDLGARGPDPVYGHGLVAAELRTPPGEVGARMALRGP